MLKRFIPDSHGLRIGLSKTGVTLLCSDGVLRRHTDIVAEHVFGAVSFSGIAGELRTVLNSVDCRRRATTIILSYDLVRLLMVSPPINASRLRDCYAAADMRFQNLYGEPIDDWTLEADWNARYPFLACAIPNELLEMLQEIASEYKLTLIKIVPQFIAAWNCWRNKLEEDAWFGVNHGKNLTLGMVANQRLCAVRTTVVPEDGLCDKSWLSGHLNREALRFNLAPPALLQLCGDFPASWAAQNDAGLICSRVDTGAGSVEMSPGVALARCGMRR